MFNLSTLSGINLQTDNYFQYTSNASTFDIKRKCVSLQTQGRFSSNARAFWMERKGVFSDMKNISFRAHFQENLQQYTCLELFTFITV